MITATPFNTSPADAADDDRLADAIEMDGRDCIARGQQVTLDRYIRAVPDLVRRVVPLDAAIDVALRSSARSRGVPRPDSADAERVSADYPLLRRAVIDALSLDAGLITTRQVHAPTRPEPLAGLPRDFGPRLTDGRERYTLTRLIGAGASGTVYAATDRHLSEPDRPAEVAIKVLSSRRAEAWISRRLTEEATKARRVDHPSVVRVLDRGGDQTDSPYIVYELVKDGDLQTWYESQNRRVPVRRAVEIVAQIARGVQAAHAAGLVHSDLKPANVLLDETGQAKVADFGIAARLHWALQESGANAGEPAGPIGNMAFIAPEQFRGEPGCLSVPADVYALGGILYALLTGTYPNGDSPAKVARNHGGASGDSPFRPPAIGSLRPEVERTLEMVCTRALAPKPGDRYASAAALADDLEAWLQFRPIAWQKPSPATIVRLWIRRRPGIALVSTLSIVLLVGGLISTGYYARIANEKEERIATQNALNRDAQKMVLDAIKMLGEVKPDGTKVSPQDLIEKMIPLERQIDQAVQPLDTSPPPPADPQSPPHGRP